MEITQANIAGLTTGYRTIFNQSLESTETFYEKVATKVTSNTSREVYPWLGQMPGMREWIGDREIQNFGSNGYMLENKPYESTVSIPVDAIEDDQYGVYKPAIQEMGRAAAKHPDELVIDAMTGGFSNKCYDGKTFFATDHKLGSRTYSNKSTLKLSRTSFRAARTSMMSIIGEKGRALGIRPDLLVISPKNEHNAKEILEASQVDGTSNTDYGLAKILVVDDLAREEEQWFLFCTNRFIKPLIYQERMKVRFTYLTGEKDPNVFMSNLYVYGAKSRGTAGYGLWQMAYGSTGETNSQG